MIGIFVGIAVIVSGCRIHDNSRKITTVKDTNIFDSTVRSMTDIDISDVETVYLPANASVIPVRSLNSQMILLTKKHYADHSVRMNNEKSIPEEGVRNMGGCAYKKEDNRLYVSTVGEFGYIEGGYSVQIEALVPERVRIEYSDDLEFKRIVRDSPHGNALADLHPDEWTRCIEVPLESNR